MAKTRHTLDFKRRVVEQMRRSENVAALARTLKLRRNLLYRWKGQLEGRPEKGMLDLRETAESRRERKLLEENRLLKESLGQRALEADFFAAALRRIEEQRRKSIASGGTDSMPKSGRGASSRRKADSK
jgi:hypothetical protein